MFRTRLTQLLGIKYPIVQGGLQWLATAELAGPVSEAGGLGIISSLSFPDREALRNGNPPDQENDQNPFGVNLSMLPELTKGDRTEEIVDVILEEKVPVVETSGRSPEPFIRRLKEEGIKLIHKVPSVRFAQKAESIGADAVTDGRIRMWRPSGYGRCHFDGPHPPCGRLGPHPRHRRGRDRRCERFLGGPGPGGGWRPDGNPIRGHP